MQSLQRTKSARLRERSKPNYVEAARSVSSGADSRYQTPDTSYEEQEKTVQSETNHKPPSSVSEGRAEAADLLLALGGPRGMICGLLPRPNGLN